MLLPVNSILNLHLLPSPASSKFRLTPNIHPQISNSLVCFSKRRCDLYDLHDEIVPYASAWAWQNAIVKERKQLKEKGEDFDDCLIVLQHNPVYTLGAGSSEEFLNFDSSAAPFDLYRTERGGEVTYHGPGQIVMYPIINLRHYKMDLHWYLRALEEVIIHSSPALRI